MTSLLLAFLLACGTPAPTPAPAEKQASTHTPAECLAQADLADGTADKVIAKCPGCGLGMEGDPMHASTIEGYTAHSCSASCKATLDADPAGVIARSCK